MKLVLIAAPTIYVQGMRMHPVEALWEKAFLNASAGKRGFTVILPQTG